MTIEITAPGVYDIPDHEYHRDPVPGGSLSASGAKKLLPPSCPARFRYWADNPGKRKREFNFGHAAHKLVLGAGADLVLIEAMDYKTKAAQETRDQALADGKTPLLPHEYQVVVDMAAAIRRHPMASALFDPSTGQPEQSLFRLDQRTGVWLRSRLDWLPFTTSGRMIIPDYKSCRSAAPDDIPKVLHAYGYHQQAAWYLDMAAALRLHPAPAFVFVFQEKDPPYLVTVVQPDKVALQIGRRLNRDAIDRYQQCLEANHWPGYSDDVELVGVPAWVENRHLEGALS